MKITATAITILKRAASLVLLVALTGCAGQSLTPSPTIPSQTSPATNDGSTLRLYVARDCGALDPLFPETRDVQQLMVLTHEPLVRYGADGTLKGCLAENWQHETVGWQTCWTFYLRKGVYFHGDDGMELTADDVVFTMEKLMGSEAQSPYRATLSLIDHYEATDRYVLKVYCKYPLRTLPEAMIFPVVSRRDYGQTAFPVGTGPYVWKPDEDTSALHLEVNQNWWRQSPKIPNIVVRYMADNDAALAAFASRQLDVVPTQNRVAGSYRKEGVSNVISCLSQMFECLIPNVKGGVLSERAVRQAIAYALDRGDIITRAYAGFGLEADVPIAPDDARYDARFSAISTNTAKARQLLEEAGWSPDEESGIYQKDGRKLSFTIKVYPDSRNPSRLEAARLVAQQLGKVGMDVSVLSLTQTQYDRALANRDFDMLYGGIGFSRLPDWRFLVQSGGESNVMGYASAAMDAALEDYFAADTDEACQQAVVRMAMQFIEDLPVIGIG
nr:ABC transporter substrate-binding protein [bacterium]